jgi:hypothetical protein
MKRLPILRRFNQDLKLTQDQIEAIDETLAPISLADAAKLYHPDELMTVKGYIYHVGIIEEFLGELP